MCGICGFNREHKQLLKKMCNLIIHRGPDDDGYYTDSNISIGMRRLPIIDLKTGHQPQHNEDETIWIVYNGEIYNFLNLKAILEEKGHNFYTESDTEVIIHSYEEWGKNCFNKFRGPFALCIYDIRNNSILLARDPIGLKPLYYYYEEERFIFSSEIKSILLHDINKELNLDAVNLYLSLKYVPFHLTLFKNIYKIPPASILKFNLMTRQLDIQKYWNLNFKINNKANLDDLAKELRNLIEESVKIRLISEVPLGAFLSGGIDSSAIVGIMAKYMEEPVKTFSIGFEEGAPVNETKYAKIISNHFDTNHTELLVKASSYKLLPKLIWHLDDLISDAAIVPVYVMAKLAKENVTVALTGDGADEIFAGYSHYYRVAYMNFLTRIQRAIILPLMKLYRGIPLQTLRIALSRLYHSKTELDRFLHTIALPDEEKAKMVNFQIEEVKNIIKSKLISNLDIINQISYWDIKYQLPSQYNMKTDKMSMAASLESRVPFLDKDMVEFSTKIPSKYKLNNGIEKFILRLAVKDLLPSEILKRKKMGFSTPMNFWLRTGLNESSGELLDRLSKRKNLINPRYTKAINRKRNHRIYENRAWNLMMFELWYETFMENDGLNPIKL
ncbi:MAG: asparagine synthase (glutamine-hydrolyzing) [Candidatus Hodarchaeota archaeon]